MFFFKRKEKRANLENPKIPISSNSIIEFFNMDGSATAGVNVTLEAALGIPALWGAVNFLSGTLAGLPLKVFKKTGNTRKQVTTGVAKILSGAINPETTSFDWIKYSFDRIFTGGRSYTLIDKNALGKITEFWPLNPEYTKVKRINGLKVYEYSPPGGKKKTYYSDEIIDIPFMLCSDGISHKSPILSNKKTIAMAIAATSYGEKFFSDGGVPPFAVIGPMQTVKGLKRASEDLQSAIREASKERRLALSLPVGHDVKSLGVDPEKSQLTETKKYLNEEIARIYSLPVVFIQDLSKGTFSNTEQQDLHLVKHTIKRWVEQMEAELNLKLFGRDNSSLYVEFVLDGLLRGDFKTRMEGYARGVSSALITPNEARLMENRPVMPGGDKLMIQGATVPIEGQLNLNLESGSANEN